MKVLLATDFSEGSARAARLAKRLVAAPSDLTIVHAVSPVGATPAAAGWVGIGAAPVATPIVDLRAVGEQLESWCASQGLRGRSVVREGLPGRTVADEARKVGAEIVVLGATGASGFERVLLGSSAHAIVRAVGCSAFVARGHVDRFSTIVFGTDFGNPAAEAARMAARLPEFAEADLVAAHVRESDTYDPAPELAAFNQELLGGRAREVVVTGPPVKTLVKIADAEQADLIVVGNEGHGMLERFILGDVAGHVVERAHCSVLVGRPPHE